MRFSSDSVDTLAAHAGRDAFATLGVHAPPIDLSSTYPFPDLDQATGALDAFAAGAATAATPIYGRLHNPTVARFEEGLALLERAEQAVAFGSGMAAITAVLLAACSRGRHVVAVRPLYGGTDHLLASGLLGIETSFVQVHEIESALRPDTALTGRFTFDTRRADVAAVQMSIEDARQEAIIRQQGREEAAEND